MREGMGKGGRPHYPTSFLPLWGSTSRSPYPTPSTQIRAIGVNGFQLLCTLSDSFEQFNPLFGPESENHNRELLSKDDNTRLDAQIRSFLRHLSPYYQLPAASKALEWLVRRYRVQEYSVDEIIRCVLPYHDTKLFVRTIQILEIRERPEWAWLIPLRKQL